MKISEFPSHFAIGLPRPNHLSSRISLTSLLQVSLATLLTLSPYALSAGAQSVLCLGAQTAVPTTGLKNARTVAVDAAGNLYIADSGNGHISKVAISAKGFGAQTTLMSLPSSGPLTGLAVDATGNIFILEGNSGVVLKETPSGTTYTQSVAVTGVGGAQGMTLDSAGNIFVADTNDDSVLKAALSAGVYSAFTPVATGIKQPEGLAVDASGNLYVASTELGIVYVVALQSPTPKPVPAIIGLNTPTALAIDLQGNLFITDSAANQLLKATSTQLAAGSTSVEGVGLSGPSGVAVDSSGNAYVADPGNTRIEQIQTLAVRFGTTNIGVSTPPQTLTYLFQADTTVGAVRVLTQGAPGLDYTANTGTCVASQTYHAGDTCTVITTFKPTLPGGRPGAATLADSSGNALSTTYLSGSGVGPQVAFTPGIPATIANGLSFLHGFGYFAGIVEDGTSNIFVTGGLGFSTVAEFQWTGNGYGAPTNVVPSNVISQPTDIAVDGGANLFVVDFLNGTVYEVPSTGTGFGAPQTVLANIGASAVAIDSVGNLYIGGESKDSLVTLRWNGNGYGAPETIWSGNDLGPGEFGPISVTVDRNGSVYFCTSDSSSIIKLPRIGSRYQSPISIPLGIRFEPTSVRVDGGGNLYVNAGSDSGSVLFKLPWNGASYGPPTALLSSPDYLLGLELDKGENLIYVDVDTDKLMKLDVADGSTINFAPTVPGFFSSDSPNLVTASNIGNAPLTFPKLTSKTNPSVTNPFLIDAKSTCPQLTPTSPAAGTLAAGASCTLAIDFHPSQFYNYTGYASLTDTTLNAITAVQKISLAGSAIRESQTISSFNPLSYGVGPIPLHAASTSGQPIGFRLVSGPGVIANSTLTVTGAGTIAIAAIQHGNTTFNAAPELTETLLVAPAPLTITANNFTMKQGSAVPPFTFTANGFVNGDTLASAVTGAPSLTTTATSRSLPGLYPIQVTTDSLRSHNYSFTAVNGTLTVTP